MKNLALMMLGVASATQTEINPIRKVVTLMQEMQKEVEAEGETEKDLFEKFMCYCKGNNESLEKQAADATAQAEQLTAKVESETGEKKQVDSDLATSKEDRATAKADLAKATKLREKEAATYAETSADAHANLEATGKAITALEKGMGGSFLQTTDGQKLKDIVSNFADNLDIDDKELVASFLEQTGDYAPQSGQIVGILKNMKDEMEKAIAEADESEAAGQASFDELKAAKTKEIDATTAAIESLTKRSGELAVSVVENKNAAKDATEEAADATAFLANLKKTCADKQKEYDTNTATRAQEIEAIGQAISILNEDDALDLFKKTLKTPTAEELHAEAQNAFMQIRTTKASKLTKVRALLATEKSASPSVSLLQHTLVSKIRAMQKSGKTDFSKVTKMIDDMVVLLGQEQKDDEKTKTWCEGEFDKSDDSKKTLTGEVKSLASSIGEMKDEIEGLKGEVKAATDRIAALDESVAEAGEQRKKENEEFTAMLAANNMAIKLIGKAKNKLMQFYNPELAVEEEPEPYVPTAEDLQNQEIANAAAGVFVQMRMSQPGPAPETASYSPKGQKSGGITALMDKLIKELEVGNADAENAEKTAQKDYEELLADADKSKKEDSKMIADKQKAKADLEESLEEAERTHSLKETALAETKTYIADLHKSCDFIMENFESRREARTKEVEGLKKAKAVLAGADYSFF